MCDGRDIRDELATARHRLRSLERAPQEGRWTRDTVAWLDAVGNQEQRIRLLESDLACHDPADCACGRCAA